MMSLTLRKCLVAKKRDDSDSWVFAHCSANGVRASKQSWQTSELILIIPSQEIYLFLWEGGVFGNYTVCQGNSK